MARKKSVPLERGKNQEGREVKPTSKAAVERPKGQHGGKRAGAGRPRGPSDVEYYRTSTERPKDPLAAIAWVMEHLTIAFERVTRDPTLDEKHRRQEMRATAKALSGLVPMERLRQAEEAIRGALENQEQLRAAPKMEAAPSGGPAPIVMGPVSTTSDSTPFAMPAAPSDDTDE